METAPENFDAALARQWLGEALRTLAAARTRLDALNVFPVPDSDTGTNVVLTVSAGVRSAQLVGEDGDLAALSQAMATGALWGARGNSGIIISQALQAIATTFAAAERVGATEMIRALDAIAIAAHDAMVKPVEGTIVTVARDVAETVLRLPVGVSLPAVARAAYEAGLESLSRTGATLSERTGRPVAMDAGAASYVVLLDALAETLGVRGRPAIAWGEGPAVAASGACLAEQGEFEVMYVFKASAREAAATRARLVAVGHSVAVVPGTDDVWHVHVHLDEPERALPATPAEQVLVRHLTAEPRAAGVVATATGPGILSDLARAGAVTTLSPSHRVLVRAVIDTGASDVTILPASVQIARLAAAVARDKEVRAEGIDVHVAPTACDPHVYAACAEWSLARLTGQCPHPREIAAGVARELNVQELSAASMHDAEAAVRAAVALARGAENATVFVGGSTLASAIATIAERALAGAGVEVARVAAGQDRPAVWLMHEA